MSVDHVILRNPYGHTEATTSGLVNSISLRDIGFTRTLDLSDSDGVFAMDFSTFRRSYTAVGVAV